MCLLGGAPPGIKSLEIGAVVGDEYAPLCRGVGKLIFISDADIGAANVVNRHSIDAASPQAIRDARVDVLIEQEGKAHRP